MEYTPLYTFDHWIDLPSDVQQDILLKLTIKDLLSCSATSKTMLEKMNKNNLLWRTLYNQRAGGRDQLNASTNNNTNWKTRYQEMFDNAHLWSCTLCKGFPITGSAYKCWNCEDFACCHSCYEKHGHFKNHVLLKYYNRLGPAHITWKIVENGYRVFKPNCAKCQTALTYPFNRSAKEQQIYLCDTCSTHPDFLQHVICRVVADEPTLDPEEEKVVFNCEECHTRHEVPTGASNWPFRCLTCRGHSAEGDICATCHSSTAVMAKHQGHNVVSMPPAASHSCLCDICRNSVRYGVRYRCSVCFDFDFCEHCEPQFMNHYEGRHPMMIIHQQPVRRHVTFSSRDNSDWCEVYFSDSE
jgi:hypothetical protein